MMRQPIVAMVNSVTWIARAQGTCPAYMFYHFIFVEEKSRHMGLGCLGVDGGFPWIPASPFGALLSSDSFNQLSIVFV